MGDEKRSLVRKLAAVMASVDRVPKSGHNNFHNYDYATEADIVAGVREEMAKQNLMIFPNVKKCDRRTTSTEKPKTITLLEVEFTVADGDSGEEKSFTVLGEGSDNEDKGTYKAFTGAEKYALLKLFLIPTGDDPEADGKSEPQPRQNSFRGGRGSGEGRKVAPAGEGPASPSPSSLPTTLPKFGKASGQPIRDAAPKDLDFYAGALRKSLEDPAKERFAASNRSMLEAIEAEVARQKGEAPATTEDKPSRPFDELWRWAESQRLTWDAVKDAIRRCSPAGAVVSRATVTEGVAAKVRGMLEAEMAAVEDDGGDPPEMGSQG